MYMMSLHLSKVRLNLAEIYHLSQDVLIWFFFSYFLLFPHNIVDRKIGSVYYRVGCERWTLNFLLLHFNAMCTPHYLINSDLPGENWESHFGHKGSDVDLHCRDYWFNFLVWGEKIVSLQYFEISGSCFHTGTPVVSCVPHLWVGGSWVSGDA